MHNRIRPSRLARALLVFLLPAKFREEISGDLEERFREIASKRGLWAAKRWYWDQLIRINPIHLRSSTKRAERGWLTDFWSDLSYAFRSLRYSPGFLIAVVLIMAAGIGVNVAMFSVTHAALLQALPFPDSERLVMGRKTVDGHERGPVAVPDYKDYRDGVDAFESLATIWSGSAFQHTITGAEYPERVGGTVVSVNLFSTLRVNPVAGRHFTAADGEPDAPRVVMISHGYWQRRFGGADDVVGSTVTISGYPHTIVGVLPAGFHFIYNVDLWRPMRRRGSRDSHSWLLIGRLRHGFSIDQAQRQVDVISQQLQSAFPETNENKGLLLNDLQDVLSETYQPRFLLLMGIVGLVLLIACGNVATLLLARSSTRAPELSVRAALGASRARLARLLFAESFLLALIAGVAGTTLAIWMQGLILTFMPLESLGIYRIGVSAPMLWFAVSISLATAVVFGGFPALISARSSHSLLFNGAARATTSRGSSRLMSSLVVLQVGLSVILLIGSGLLLRSFVRLGQVDLGFDTENLLTAYVPIPATKYQEEASRTRFFSGLLDDIRAIPGVRSASAVDKIPIQSPWMNWGVSNPENPTTNDREWQSAFARTVLPGYFETMGIRILDGRDIEDTDVAEAQRVVVINESMARGLYPDQDPVGRSVVIHLRAFTPTTLQIVGVVSDARVNRIALEPGFQVYLSHAQMGYTGMSVAIRTNVDPVSVVRPLRNALAARDPDVPLASLTTMQEILSDSIAATRVLNATVAIFAAGAMFLVAVGLYGVIAYHVARRLHDIGIRMALGATGANVLRLVLKKGVSLVAFGLGMGFIVAVGASRVLRQQLFGVEPTDPGTYAGVAACFLLIGILASLVPAVRAVRADPLISLRGD